ncbi:hypothetical protein SAMN02799624_05827 [Paenibacillus sp. UNC496MF]|uniref:hypothetical protein n=1 Tax=Paenibacillus sp. UNC496MF TaxID=1502753 RepID=UPI0008F14FC3|nr:hypothetical protein [Paenibacillus sp. UNC496MF]SFJ76148.1 hypothetical protein SAMN02799624_05827 [Paenibacillus sp. UNC496MF]
MRDRLIRIAIVALIVGVALGSNLKGLRLMDWMLLASFAVLSFCAGVMQGRAIANFYAGLITAEVRTAVIAASFGVIVALKTLIAMSHVSNLQNSGTSLLVQICFSIFGLFLGRGILLRYYQPSRSLSKNGWMKGSSLHVAQNPARQKEIPRIHLIIRGLVGALLVAGVLTAFSALLTSNAGLKTFSIQNITIQVLSGVLYVGIMFPLARQVTGPFSRFLAIFVPLYVTGALADLVEAYFYTTLLTLAKLFGALIIEAFPLTIIACIIAWLFPATVKARCTSRLGEIFSERPFTSWVWRIVLAGVPYAAIYLLFGALVTPIEHAYYHDQAFLATLHTRVPSTTTTLILEASRGILFVCALLPVIAFTRYSRWATGLYLALIGAVLEAWVPLLGYTSWPMMMRVGNVLELTGDAFGRALLMTLLVVLPRHQSDAKVSENSPTYFP